MNEQVCRNCRAELVWLGSMKDGQLGCPHGCELHDYEEPRVGADCGRLVADPNWSGPGHRLVIDPKAVEPQDRCNLADEWKVFLDAIEGKMRDPKTSDFLTGQIGRLEWMKIIHSSPRQCGKSELKRMRLSGGWDKKLKALANTCTMEEAEESMQKWLSSPAKDPVPVKPYEPIKDILKRTRSLGEIVPAQHYGLDLAMFPEIMRGAVYRVSVDEEGFPKIELLEYQHFYGDQP